jgi:hypothetical protein
MPHFILMSHAPCTINITAQSHSCTHFISKEMNEFQIKYFIVSRNFNLILTHTGLKQLQIYNFKSGSWHYKIRTWNIPYSTHRNVKLVSHFLPQTYDGEHFILQNTLRTCPTDQYIYMTAKDVLWLSFWLWFEPPSQYFFLLLCV